MMQVRNALLEKDIAAEGGIELFDVSILRARPPDLPVLAVLVLGVMSTTRDVEVVARLIAADLHNTPDRSARILR